MIRELCIKYFRAFENKDLDALAEMFADNVRLRDWEIDVCKKSEVLKANENIFEVADVLEVEILEIHVTGTTAACEIKIKINEDFILVTDIIGFSSDNKIEFVRAYRG